MTVKELSEFTGKTERTVRSWISNAGDKIKPVPYETISQGIPHQYSIDDVETILNSGSMSKDAVRILMENARREVSIAAVPFNMEDFAAVIGASISSALSPVIERLERLESSNIPIKNKLAALPAPDVNLRDRLRKSINDYSLSHFDGDRREAWNSLYQEIYYRMHRNIRLSAKNRNMQKLDYLESEGLLLNSITIIEELQGE